MTGGASTLAQILTEFLGAPPRLPSDASDEAPPKTSRRAPTMSDEERFSVVQMYEFAKKGNKGKVPRGFRTKVADHFHVSTRTIDSILKRWTMNGGSMRQSSKSGRHSKYSDLIERFVKLAVEKRRTVRLAAEHLNVPRSVIHDRIKSGQLVRVNSRAKPSLNDTNKLWRLEFVLDHVRLARRQKFSEMYDPECTSTREVLLY